MLFISQCSTATIKIGPFVDDSNGAVAETGLTLTQASIRLSKNGGNIVQKAHTSSCTHDEIGIYDCSIGSADTNTLGRLQLFVHQTGSLSVFHEYMIIPKQVYDSLIAGSDNLDVETKSFLSTLDFTTQMKSSILTQCLSALTTGTVTVGTKTGFSLAADQSGVTIGTVCALGTNAKADVLAECGSALNTAFIDATGLVANGVKDRLRTLGWLVGNKMAVTDANGNTVIYKDDSITQAFSVAGALTDDSTTTTRLRIA